MIERVVEVQDPEQQREIDRLTRRVTEVEEERDDARDVAAVAARREASWRTEAQRLQAELDRRDTEPAPPERIGTFGPDNSVMQSPPPGREVVGEPITLTLTGRARNDVRWEIDGCTPDKIGGSTGPTRIFSAPTEMSCAFTISYREGIYLHRSEPYWVHIRHRR